MTDFAHLDKRNFLATCGKLAASMFDPTQTIVIADFDGTFTKKEVLGKKTSSLMTVLVNDKYLGPAGTKACQDLFEQYYPIELDPHLDLAEKSRLMREWWLKTTAVLQQSGVTKQMLLEVCDSPLIAWRDELLDFLELLRTQQIPLIIFSAGGFGQLAIEYLLAKAGHLHEQVRVVSNRVVFDERDALITIAEPLIHIANKTGTVLVQNQILSLRPAQRQCLLLGDTLEDVRMVEGLDFDLVHKVAFSSHNLEHFQEKFDLVLPVDASYRQVIELFA